MPLTKKGAKIKKAMQKSYGAAKGEKVFYASQAKGTITGTHKVGAKAKKSKTPAAGPGRVGAKSGKTR